MGKKSKATPKVATPSPPVTVPAVAQTAAVPTSTSSSASANSYQNLIRALVSIPEGACDERNEIIEKLAAEYKALASANRLNKQKEECLSKELAITEPKFKEASEAAAKVKAEHDAVSAKYNKLRQLSLQLSERTKQADARTATLLYEEQQKRVKLTEEFSASISTISAKLETLAARREAVVTENVQLKTVLRNYLAEFDALEGKTAEQDKDTPTSADASQTGNADSSGTEDSKEAQNEQQPDKSGTAEAVEAGATEEAELMNEENAASANATDETAPSEDTAAAEETERADMRYQEDLSRLAALKATEQQLRAKTARYATLFETFQTQLSHCNDAFTQKQASIAALTKEIQRLEKDNAALAKKTADVELSTKVMVNMCNNAVAEKEKQQKLLDRYNGLCELLQREIASASGGTSDGGKST